MQDIYFINERTVEEGQVDIVTHLVACRNYDGSLGTVPNSIFRMIISEMDVWGVGATFCFSLLLEKYPLSWF